MVKNKKKSSLHRKLHRVGRGLAGAAVGKIPGAGGFLAIVNAKRIVDKNKLKGNAAKKTYAKHLAISSIPVAGDSYEGFQVGYNTRSMRGVKNIAKSLKKDFNETSPAKKALMVGSGLAGLGASAFVAHKAKNLLKLRK